MKKTLRKPEHWQDFESLCKKLWGEIWSIPNTIKKNGRLGQKQSGVDVYGKPQGEDLYWGIQAKGKDDYSNAKLTEKEIIIEIEKAKAFKPELKVYIIATTASKDSKIEEFIRLKDIQSQDTNSFEILLFCWEDIVDLIEENQDTYNWYLNESNQKGRYDFKISFNDFKESLTLKPLLNKRTTRYKITEKSDLELMITATSPFADSIYNDIYLPSEINFINKSWCKFDLRMENNGSIVIEDWHVSLKFVEGVERLESKEDIFQRISMSDCVDNETKTITYCPLDNSPLIQKDSRSFSISLLPKTMAEKIIVEWKLLARDYNRTERFQINLKPKYVNKVETIEVNKESELNKDKIHISYVVEKEKNNA